MNDAPLQMAPTVLPSRKARATNSSTRPASGFVPAHAADPEPMRHNLGACCRSHSRAGVLKPPIELTASAVGATVAVVYRVSPSGVTPELSAAARGAASHSAYLSSRTKSTLFFMNHTGFNRCEDTKNFIGRSGAASLYWAECDIIAPLRRSQQPSHEVSRPASVSISSVEWSMPCSASRCLARRRTLSHDDRSSTTRCAVMAFWVVLMPHICI